MSSPPAAAPAESSADLLLVARAGRSGALLHRAIRTASVGRALPISGQFTPTSATNTQVTRQEEGEFAPQLHMRGANATVAPGETRRVGS